MSPGLEGPVWQRSDGNSLDGLAEGGADWLLQTPGCWGDAGCADRSGTKNLLSKMTADVSRAERTVDISTLAPFPDGAFQDAIVAGLKEAARTHHVKVRILIGSVPVLSRKEKPDAYRDELIRKLGSAAGNVTLNVAAATTSRTSLSWNHSKLLLVDGRSVISGGINDWSGAYVDTAHPVTDVDLALSGPAAASAGQYLDTLWGFACKHIGPASHTWFAGSNGAACMPDLERESNPEPSAPTGNVPVIAVGGLGVGIRKNDPKSTYKPEFPDTPADLTCKKLKLPDNTNARRDYETVNPEENALRSLVASATHDVVISQQDMSGPCPPLPRYDVRLYDTLAAKLVEGVKVRLVVSDPANKGSGSDGGYSNITSLKEISDSLRGRIDKITGDAAKSEQVMRRNLQLASFRAAAEATWADGTPYALHHKLVAVDDAAFYIGSKNAYPAWLQDYGHIVEDKQAAAQLKKRLLDPEWTYSKATATYDYERAGG
ncbi:phospholipase D-like domain-containing protein [Streptomyces solincola]|uniref:phospholipase D-like domain-containing protein n=1 Tax=Streptomyces solincola TaxID=2100817 RepID=UPI0021597CBA|nr:phospholipase D-like domain-containing protein [Streptomyces solincola]